MIAQTLAMALVLASPGARPALEPLPDNAARARRGLLPRKVAKPRPASRVRRVVLLPPAPTWLGEPGEVTEPLAGPVPEPVAAPVVSVRLEPAADVPAPVDPPAEVASAEPGSAPAVEPDVASAEGEPLVVALATVAAAPSSADPGPAPQEERAPLSAAVEGVEVAWLLVRRVQEEGEGAVVRATVAEPALEVLVVRRPADPE